MYIDLLSQSKSYFERTDTLCRYFDDIRKYKVLSKEEEQYYISVLHNIDASEEEKNCALSELVKANQRLVVSLARKFADNTNILDVIEEGNIGLIEGIQKYDPNSDCRLMTFAVYFVYRNINNFIMKTDCLIRKSGKDKAYHIIAKATNKFIQKEQREPTPDELQELILKEYGIKVPSSLDLVDSNSVSIDVPPTEGEQFSSKDITQFNTKSASFNDYEKKEELEYIASKAKSLLGRLKPNEAKILTLLFGIGMERALGLSEVAAETGYTTERVRQIRTEAITKLRKYYNSVVL